VSWLVQWPCWVPCYISYSASPVPFLRPMSHLQFCWC